MDVEHDLALDQQVDLEHEAVERRAHGSLDRVLYRKEAEIDLPGADRVEHVGEGRLRDRSCDQIGLSRQRLFCEGPGRSQERDRHRPRRLRPRPSTGSQPAPWAGRIVVPMDEPALKQLIQDLLAGTVTPDEAVSQAEKTSVRRSRVRKGGPPPRSAAALRRGRLRPGKDRRAVRRDRRGAAGRARGEPGASHRERIATRSQGASAAAPEGS